MASRPPAKGKALVTGFTGQPAPLYRFAEILYGKNDGVGRVTLNRPEAYNAYSAQTLQEIWPKN